MEKKWVPEVSHYCPNTPIVLVGLKGDYRTSGAAEKKKVITFDSGLRLANRISAITYLECSAIKGTGVEKAIECASRAALLPKERKKRKRFNGCRVM